MRPIIIDGRAKESIRAMVQFAKENPLTIDNVLDVANGQREAPGDMHGYRCYVDMGYKIVYSIEHTPIGLVQHLSMSVDTPGKAPSSEAVQLIMSEIGFHKQLGDCQIWVEDIAKDAVAINVVEALVLKRGE